MKMLNYQAFDQEIWDTELASFVPETVYDMHIHMWSDIHRGQLTSEATGLRLDIDYKDHLAWAQKLFPGRKCTTSSLGLLFRGGLT